MYLHNSTNPYSTFLLFNENTRVAIIDGKYCADKKNFYDTLSKALTLPNYFGRNLDALDEILNDLDWLEQPNCQLIIYNTDLMLLDDIDFKTNLLEVLNQVDSDDMEIILMA